MSRRNPQHWAAPPQLDPSQDPLVRGPERFEPGYWAGAPGAFYDEETSTFYLTYRLRRPRGVEPDRGAELHLASSRDGVEFETIWRAEKAQLETTSIERCGLRRLADDAWALYVSYVDPADSRWCVDVVQAEAPQQFDLSRAQPLLRAQPLGLEGVKDPFIFRVAGQYLMLLSIARTATDAADASHEQLHGTHDAYNTGLIRSATGLATSPDGLRWDWQGEVFAPHENHWDGYCSRIGSVYREDGIWIGLYDGSASAEQNYEERLGLAYSFDLRSFHRVTTDKPWQEHLPNRALRYVDVLPFPGIRYFYYEVARSDGSHELRVHVDG